MARGNRAPQPTKPVDYSSALKKNIGPSRSKVTYDLHKSPWTDPKDESGWFWPAGYPVRQPSPAVKTPQTPSIAPAVPRTPSPNPWDMKPDLAAWERPAGPNDGPFDAKVLEKQAHVDSVYEFIPFWLKNVEAAEKGKELRFEDFYNELEKEREKTGWLAPVKGDGRPEWLKEAAKQWEGWPSEKEGGEEALGATPAAAQEPYRPWAWNESTAPTSWRYCAWEGFFTKEEIEQMEKNEPTADAAVPAADAPLNAHADKLGNHAEPATGEGKKTRRGRRKAKKEDGGAQGKENGESVKPAVGGEPKLTGKANKRKERR